MKKIKKSEKKILSGVLKSFSFNTRRFLSESGIKSTAIALSLVMIVSSLPVITLTASAANNNNSQTKYSDINEYQKARISEIQKEIFDVPEEYTDDGELDIIRERLSGGSQIPLGYDDKGDYNDDNDELKMIQLKVKEDNDLFKWKEDLGVEKWDGFQGYQMKDSTEEQERIAKLNFKTSDNTTIKLIEDFQKLPTVYFKYKDLETGSESAYKKFIEFNVENANQFRFALEYTMHNKKDNILINIGKDIDLAGYRNYNDGYISTGDYTSGSEYLQKNRDWNSIDYNGKVRNVDSVVYIEGNGHSIYNMKTSQNGLFNNVCANLIMKNLGISNSMIIKGRGSQSPVGLIYGTVGYGNISGSEKYQVYLYNVHGSDSYIQNINKDYAGGLTGWSQRHSGLFVQNTSTSNLIVVGKSHVGGLASNTQSRANLPEGEKFDYKFSLSENDPMDIVFNNNEIPGVSQNVYPAVFENSYSVDCELFSLGDDSGSFISCGLGIIAKNCYTNNNIYSDQNTAGFIGRVISAAAINDITGQANITAYFDSCYSSGIVEGRNLMGGFVGFVVSLRDLQKPYEMNEKQFAADEFSDGSLKTNFGSAVFYNCYTTSAVGMDYAGRYCGGFVGLDENYALDTTIEYEGKEINFNGSAYINCYAAGEVGNILTVTDKSAAKEYEANFLHAESYDDDGNPQGEGYSNKNADTSEITILEYYPTGGFIGVLCPDRWWVADAEAYNWEKHAYFTPGSYAEENYSGSDLDDYKAYKYVYGYFDNCYYDMQTTAMREMAIGMAGGNYEPDPDYWYDYLPDYMIGVYDDVNLEFSTCSGDDYTDAGKKPESSFTLQGVTGLYTTTAEAKPFYGLTDFPIEADDFNKDIQTNNSGFKMKMDNCSLTFENNSWHCDHWRYEDGYYPQLWPFMEVHDEIKDDNYDEYEFTEDQIKKSPFYIKEDKDESYQGSLGGETINYKNGTRAVEGDEFKNITMALRAYRYSQASTAAVVLNNYNYIMDASGSLMNDNDWAVAQPSNKMEFNEETGYWQVGYKGLNGGTYEFKVQANESMTYNYGKNKFDDATNCKLVIDEDGTDVVIRFKYSELFSNDYQIVADIYDSHGWEYENHQYRGKISETRELGGRNSEIKYSIIGSFTDNWTSDLNLEPVDNTHKLQEVVRSFSPEEVVKDGAPIKHEFKVRGNHDWNVANYGYNGVDNGTNMSFILAEPCNVKFSFDRDTHKCELYIKKDGQWHRADDTAVADICTESSIADYTNYTYDSFAVISDKKEITGQRWSDIEDVGAKNTEAKKHIMESNEKENEYTFTADGVPTGKNYQIRIVQFDSKNKAALDNTNNRYFYIPQSASAAPGETCTLTITYNSSTDKVTYKAVVTDGGTELTVSNNVSAENFVVAGDTNLTGYHWLGSDISQIQKDLGVDDVPTKEQIDAYVAEAKEKGKMTHDDTSAANNIYSWTSPNAIPAGAYTFKIFADGDIDLGFGDNGSASNIKFSLKEPSKVTIRFNADNHLTSISAEVPNALEITQYVVTGTENLMGNGYVWNLYNGIMTNNIESGLYEYTILGKDNQPIAAGQNYAFKVVEYGIDSGNNISFYLAKPAYIKVTYNAVTGDVNYTAYKNSQCTEPYDDGEAIRDVQINSYSVIGGLGLVHDKYGNTYNWLGLQQNGQPLDDPAEKKKAEAAASEAGKMTLDPNTGTYHVQFDNVPVGVHGEFISYPFKIAANGNWDSGISYGNGNDNYIIALGNPDDGKNDKEGDAYYNYCTIKITFNPKVDDDKKISVEALPKEICGSYIWNTIDDSQFNWYVVGDQELASYSDAFRGAVTTYDTVRDITQTIRFTNGSGTVEKGIAWSLDEEMNEDAGYISKFGGSESGNQNSGFTLDYNVDSKSVRVRFDENVIGLDTMVDDSESANKLPQENPSTISDGDIDAHLDSYLDLDTLYQQWNTDTEAYRKYIDIPITYTSEHFMPGKQFLNVSAYGMGTNKDFNNWKLVRVLYDQFTIRKEDVYDKLKTLMLLVDSAELAKYESDSSGNKRTAYEQLVEYMRNMKKNDEEQYAHYIEGFDVVHYYDQLIKLHEKLLEYKQKPDFSAQFKTGGANGDFGSASYGNDIILYDAPVVSEENAIVTGSRLIRLIPKGYIEAGNDAVVTVIDDKEKKEKNRQNVVLYDSENSSSGVTATLMENGVPSETKSIGDETFSYYNFALMAGYAITDKIGLGIYDNYSNQGTQSEDNTSGIVKFAEDLRRDEDDNEARSYDSYYAMTSAFHETPSYNDNAVVDRGNVVWKEPNLSVGTLVDQELIGDSSRTSAEGDVDDNTNQRAGQTIVKIYQVLNKGKRNESERIVLTKQSTTEDSNSESNMNYQKWTGVKKFESSDEGDYRVKIYWAMNDGRYFTDTKDVQVLANISGIVKSVDKSVDDAKYDPSTNELTYTLKYTNSVSAQPVTFAILDILPYQGDERINSNIIDQTGSEQEIKNDKTKMTGDRDPEFTVTKLEITREGNQNTKKAEIKGVYLSSAENVRELLYDLDENGNTTTVSKEAAEKLGINIAPVDIDQFMDSGNTAKIDYFNKVGKINDTVKTTYGWNELKRGTVTGGDTGTDGVYTFDEGDNAQFSKKVKAIAVTGIQLASADSVTVKITLHFNGKPNDDLFNNAYFYSAFNAKWNEATGSIDKGDVSDLNGYSDNVRTTIVGRDLNGTVFLDKDVNGTLDRNAEPVIENVLVELYEIPTEDDGTQGSPKRVATRYTDAKGNYNFDDVVLAQGNYKVVFKKSDKTDGKVTLNYLMEDGNIDSSKETAPMNFSDLRISRTIESVNNVDNNIAKIDGADADVREYYIDEAFPGAGEIFSDSFTGVVNVHKNKDEFVYIKEKQDLALTDAYGSITIKKYGDNKKDAPLEGIKFKIEYFDGVDWKPLKYNSLGFIDQESPLEGSNGEYTTNGQGTITVENLYPTTYRITEISTDDDHNPLLKPIEITIPYNSTDTKSNIVTKTDGGNEYEEGGKIYWRDITITLSNTTKLNDYLPLTGSTEGFNYWIPIAGLIFVIIGAGVILYAVKKRKAKKSGCK